MPDGERVLVRSRVTLLAGRGRVDVEVPADVPVADLLPELTALAGQGDLDALPRAWVLSRVGGRVLDPERSLAEGGVVDGTVLELLPAPDVRTAVVSDRLDEVADAVGRAPGSWREDQRALVLGAAAAGLIALGAPMVGAAGPRATAAAGAALVAVAVTTGAFGIRRRGRAGLAAAVGAGGLAWWAAAGVALAADGARPLSVLVAGGALGLLCGAVCAGAASARPAPFAGAGLMAVLTLVGTVAVAEGLKVAGAAAIVALVAATLPVLFPAAVVRFAGVERFVESGWLPGQGVGGGHRPGAAGVVVQRARDLSTWLLVGDLAVLVGAGAVLGASRDGWAVALGLVAAISVALRFRLFRATSEVAVLSTGSLLTVAAVLAGRAAVTRGDSLRYLGAGAFALGVSVLVAALARPASGPRARRRLDRLQLAADIALVPLVLGAVGIYGAVRHAVGEPSAKEVLPAVVHRLTDLI